MKLFSLIVAFVLFVAVAVPLSSVVLSLCRLSTVARVMLRVSFLSCQDEERDGCVDSVLKPV